MKKMFLVYKTDAQHSYASRDLIAVCDKKDLAISICEKQAKKEGGKLSKDSLYNLEHINQTQEYKGDGEFVIDVTEINTLL